MDEQKKVLVIGEPEATPQLLQELCQDCELYTQYEGDNQTVKSEAKSGEHFDYIVIRTAGLKKKESVLAQCLAGMGILIEDLPYHHCAVEWLDDGSLQLHCCLRPSLHSGYHTKNHWSLQQEQGYTFEYQAPMKKPDDFFSNGR